MGYYIVEYYEVDEDLSIHLQQDKFYTLQEADEAYDIVRNHPSCYNVQVHCMWED
jgi:hypothetical protein